jgi:catechol 2,3-dioxygenase-like lactoylglutathione lyase family enzyme
MTQQPRTPEIVGLHHVRLPVSDVLASRDWYVDVFGFESILVEEDEDRITGLVLEHPSGVVLGVHADRARAAALRGFVVVAFGVRDLSWWVDYLDRRGITHGRAGQQHLGRSVQVADPDGICVALASLDQPSAGEA